MGADRADKVSSHPLITALRDTGKRRFAVTDFASSDSAAIPVVSEWKLAISALNSVGCVLTQGITVDQMREHCLSFAELFDHPDADAKGVTTIRPMERVGRGFSRQRLVLHTDSSMASAPPSLLALVLEQPAASGGEALFLDGESLVEGLMQDGFSFADLLGIKIQAHEDAYGVPFLSQDEPDSYTIRYRDDHVGGPSSDLPELVERLRERVSQDAFRVSLNRGEGYILNNRRWLHGRTSFEGERRASRLLFTTSSLSSIGVPHDK